MVAYAAMLIVLGLIAIGLFVLSVDAAGWKGGLAVMIVYIALAIAIVT